MSKHKPRLFEGAATALITPFVKESQRIDESAFRALIEEQIDAGISALVKLILLSLGLHLMSNLISVGQNYLNNWIAQHISYDMRNQMYRHLQKMSQRFFTSANQGDIITRMTSDISGVESVVTGTFASILPIAA